MKKTLLALTLAGALFAHRNSFVRDMPLYSNGGKPDLAVDMERLMQQLEIVDRKFEPDSCEIKEYAVAAPGVRRLLRFDVVIMNRGGGDLVVGDRADSSNPYAKWFYYAECHAHYHIRDFSTYELYTLDGKLAAKGTKAGFCFQDDLRYDENRSSGYTCNNQGITQGWGDWYYKQLAGQWVDITGAPEGEYILKISINVGDNPKQGIFNEGENRYPNVYEVKVSIPNPRKKVDVVNE